MGAWTRSRALLLGLFAAVAAGNAAAAEQCELHRIAEIPARISPDNELVVAADLDGTPVDLELDTGLGFSAINRRFAERKQLPIENLHAPLYDIPNWSLRRWFDVAFDARERVPTDLTERTRVSHMILGNARSDDETFAVIPVGGDGTDGKPVGIFGADYLAGYDVEIDPAGGKVRLFDPNRCPGKMVYWSRDFSTLPLHFDPKTRLATVPVELDGKPLTAAIDTGAHWTGMRLATARRVFGLTEQDAALDPAPPETDIDGRPVDTYWARFAVLKIGGVLVRHPRIAVHAPAVSDRLQTGTHIPSDGGPDLLIGMNVLKTLRFAIAYREGLLYYTAATPETPTTPVAPSGK